MMDEERNEILNTIQNGFFNEGIYRINDDSIIIPQEVIVPVTVHKKVMEIFTPPEQVISIAEEPEKELTPVKKEDEPEKTGSELTPMAPMIVEEPVNLPEQEKTPEFFGENKKGVVILVNYPDERWIYFKDKIILERILASIKLTFEDVALINTHFYKPESIDELSDTLSISKLIGFGINDPFLKGLKREEPEKTTKTAVFLMNSDLDEIAMDNSKKRILWNNLKVMFNI
jgi:hypothetical protein